MGADWCKLKGTVQDRPRVAPFAPAGRPKATGVTGLQELRVGEGHDGERCSCTSIGPPLLDRELGRLGREAQSPTSLHPLGCPLAKQGKISGSDLGHIPPRKPKGEINLEPKLAQD